MYHNYLADSLRWDFAVELSFSWFWPAFICTSIDYRMLWKWLHDFWGEIRGRNTVSFSFFSPFFSLSISPPLSVALVLCLWISKIIFRKKIYYNALRNKRCQKSDMYEQFASKFSRYYCPIFFMWDLLFLKSSIGLCYKMANYKIIDIIHS